MPNWFHSHSKFYPNSFCATHYSIFIIQHDDTLFNHSSCNICLYHFSSFFYWNNHILWEIFLQDWNGETGKRKMLFTDRITLNVTKSDWKIDGISKWFTFLFKMSKDEQRFTVNINQFCKTNTEREKLINLIVNLNVFEVSFCFIFSSIFSIIAKWIQWD